MRPIIVFSDFDGTITQQDTGNIIIDKCIGTEKRIRLDDSILDGTCSFRDANNEMWTSVNLETFSEAIALLKANNVSHDVEFGRFHSILTRLNIPLKVVSAGLKPIVTLYMESFGNCEIYANDCSIERAPDGSASWKLKYVDESPFGHDKGAPIRLLKEQFKAAGLSEEERPRILFIGDGVSDLSAARDADFVFAKKGKDLETYCQREGISGVIVWEDFGAICNWLETWAAAV
ncbi:HAD-like domain-containing protein [Chytriomyces cf. hyalinus JEL632]|nr:HAD-like domain-containing protein [Chytriomyces cf. hyalinus JEL632]